MSVSVASLTPFSQNGLPPPMPPALAVLLLLAPPCPPSAPEDADEEELDEEAMFAPTPASGNGACSRSSSPQPPKSASKDQKTASTKQACPDDFKPTPELDGKNDSGPDPEVHDRELPPQ